MNKLFAFLMAMVCLLFVACDKEDVLLEPMKWSQTKRTVPLV